MVKKLLVLTVAAFAGNWLANQFLIYDVNEKGEKVGMGFVANDPGSAFGMDDFVRALSIAFVVILIGRFVKD